MYSDYYGYMDLPSSGEAADVLLTFLVVYLIVLLLALAYSVVVYVLHSLGTYTIAKRRGIHHPWLSWIPVGNVWILGSISDQYQYVAKGRIRNRRKTLLGLTIATYVLMIPLWISYFVFLFSAMDSIGSDYYGNVAEVMTPMLIMMGIALVMMVAAIVLTVFQYIAYYDLFASCNPDNAVIFLVLGIIFSFTLPYFVFACRKKDLGMPPRKAQILAPTGQSAPPQPQPVWQPAEPEAPVEPEATLSEPEATLSEPEDKTEE